MEIESPKSLLVTDSATENISSEALASYGKGEIHKLQAKPPYYKSLWKI